MSWGGFKKAINRAGNTVIIKDIDKITDKEFEAEQRRYETLKKTSEQLAIEAKAYLDSFRIVSSSQLRIAEVVSNLYENTEETKNDMIAKQYLQTSQDIDTQIVKQLDEPYIETILNPILKFSGYFKEIDDAIKKRDHKRKDYEATKAKVRRLTDKPAKDATKLPRNEKELQLAKELYGTLNEQLKTELPQLIALRVPYLDPSFEALIKIQYRFSTDSYVRLSQLQQYVAANMRDDYINGTLDNNIDNIIKQVYSLDICALGIK